MACSDSTRRREGPRGRFHMINHISQNLKIARTMQKNDGKSSAKVLLARSEISD
jgi:hypothetical protein